MNLRSASGRNLRSRPRTHLKELKDGVGKARSASGSKEKKVLVGQIKNSTLTNQDGEVAHISSQNCTKLIKCLLNIKKQLQSSEEKGYGKNFQKIIKQLKKQTAESHLKVMKQLQKISLCPKFQSLVSSLIISSSQVLKIVQIIKEQMKQGKKKQLLTIIQHCQRILSPLDKQEQEKQKDTKLKQQRAPRQYQTIMALFKIEKKAASQPNGIVKIEKKKQSPELTLKVQKTKCPNKNCHKFLEDKICEGNNHLMVICDRCKWTNHQCQKTQQLKQIPDRNEKIMKIIANGQKINFFPDKSVKKGLNKNNIKQIVDEKGYKFVERTRIIPGTPQQISSFYPIITGKARDLICTNRKEEEYLPLRIDKSSIPEAGLGVFATKNIDGPNTLVCSYLGQIGIGSQTPITRPQQNHGKNDSIFTLGWLNTQILIMAPNLYSNVGRFINYNTPQKCNLKPNLCLLETGQNEYEIAVFLTTTRRIKAGEELYYNYGSDYYV